MSINFDELRQSIFNEHNRIRADPQSYVEILENQIKFFKGDILYRPGEVPIQTNEGVKAYEQAIEFLKQKTPVPVLTYDERLSRACADHVADIGPKGLLTHESSDGKNVSDRIEKYAEWEGACSENIDFGAKTAIDVIVCLVVDDGVPNRGHRRNLFNPDVKYIGIGCGVHREFEVVSIIDYVGGLRDIGKPYFDYKNFKYTYPPLDKDGKVIGAADKKKKPKNSFQEDDEDAPDGTVSVKIVKLTKTYEGKQHKITRKIYSLEDGTQHVVEIEDF